MMKWKKVLAVLLAGTMLVAMGAIGYATEAVSDPEKDLVIGSEYGGGGSPGSESLDADDSRIEGGDEQILGPTLSDSEMAAYTAWLEQHFADDGVSIADGADDGFVSVDYGMGETLFDDGSIGVTVMFTNYCKQDIPLYFSTVSEDSHGVLQTSSIGSGYTDGFVLKSGYRRAFQIFVEEGQYSKINCILSDLSKNVENAATDSFSFTIRHGIEDVKTILMEQVHEPKFSSDIDMSGSGKPADCPTCGITQDMETEDNSSILVWVAIIIIIIIVVLLVVLYMQYRKHVKNRET